MLSLYVDLIVLFLSPGTVGKNGQEEEMVFFWGFVLGVAVTLVIEWRYSKNPDPYVDSEEAEEMRVMGSLYSPDHF